jgi:hypothetical protein
MHWLRCVPLDRSVQKAVPLGRATSSMNGEASLPASVEPCVPKSRDAAD